MAEAQAGEKLDIHAQVEFLRDTVALADRLFGRTRTAANLLGKAQEPRAIPLTAEERAAYVKVAWLELTEALRLLRPLGRRLEGSLKGLAEAGGMEAR